jgi:hypothetical protein
MLKFIRLTLFCCLLPLLLTAQSKYSFFSEGHDGKVGVMVDHSSFINNYYTTGAGINLEGSGERFGVSYGAVLGVCSDGRFYASSGVGQVAAFWLAKNGGSGLPWWAFIGVFVPETFMVHTYPVKGSRLSLYLSPWGVERRGADPVKKEIKVSIETGLKYALKLNDMYFEPFGGFKAIYGTERLGFTAGFTFYLKSF